MLSDPHTRSAWTVPQFGGAPFQNKEAIGYGSKDWRCVNNPLSALAGVTQDADVPVVICTALEPENCEIRRPETRRNEFYTLSTV